MSTKALEIGQVIEGIECLGDVKIIDIFISPTTQERAYKVIDASGDDYLVDAKELTQ